MEKEKKEKCKNCNKNKNLYKCPNCDINICNQNCYKNHNNKICYEKFCKKNVIDKLKKKKISEIEKKKFKKKINNFRYNDEIENDILDEKKEKKFLDILEKIEKPNFNFLDLEKKDQKDFLEFLKNQKIKLWTPIWEISEFVPNFNIEEINKNISKKKIDDFYYYQIIKLSTNSDFSLEKVYNQSVNLKDIKKINKNENDIFTNGKEIKKNLKENFLKNKNKKEFQKNLKNNLQEKKKKNKNSLQKKEENKKQIEYLEKLKNKRKTLLEFLKEIKNKNLGKNSKLKYNYLYSTIIISHILDLYNGDYKDLNSEFILQIIKINDCFKNNSKKIFFNLENIFFDLKKKFLFNNIILKKTILKNIYFLRFFSCEILFCFYEALEIYLDNINNLFEKKNLVLKFKEVRNLQKKIIFYLSYFLNLSNQEFIEIKNEIEKFTLE